MCLNSLRLPLSSASLSCLQSVILALRVSEYLFIPSHPKYLFPVSTEVSVSPSEFCFVKVLIPKPSFVIISVYSLFLFPPFQE